MDQDKISFLSLNKAANFLGVNEIVNLDQKSINSIRKLSKTLGCMEHDLLKDICSPKEANPEIIIE